MKKIINAQMALLAVGVLQPTSASEVRAFLSSIFREGGALPPLEEFEGFLSAQERAKRVIRLSVGTASFYSLTMLGSLYLTPDVRKKRDKFRAYLLRDAHRARFITSREADGELAGVSPATDTSSSVKGRAANKLGRTAFGRRFAYGQPYWPRISGQFIKRTGLARSSRDTFPNLLSFETKQQVELATEREFAFDYVGIGICVGLSPQLVWNISHQPGVHYRAFAIPKKGGGSRLIESPRIFLKVIQWFLADFVLDDLPVHESVHSFSMKRSTATNAECHIARNYVGSADIENFFGSVSEASIVKMLANNKFNPLEAVAVAKICTNRGVLPQGAPTSPVLSNSILSEVDDTMVSFCKNKNMTYTRYADDISVSGDDRGEVNTALLTFQLKLAFLGLRLNESKKRIASFVGQQKVTGAVVNFAAAPPRLLRRRIRAIFHKASVNHSTGVKSIPLLGGFLGYLKTFPRMQQKIEIEKYQQIIVDLRKSVQNPEILSGP